MSGVENKPLPAIPAKRYFTIGEVSELCGVKAYVLRYWEQEFAQLKPMKRRGNRRYYQHHEVLLIRRIRDLLYEQGFTISGARNQLTDTAAGHAHALSNVYAYADDPFDADESRAGADDDPAQAQPALPSTKTSVQPRDPATRTRASDAVGAEAAPADESAADAQAREDLATVTRGRRELGDARRAARLADTAVLEAAAPSMAAGSAGIRAAAIQTRRSSHGTLAAAPLDDVYSAEQVRTELLAIRSLLVG